MIALHTILNSLGDRLAFLTDDNVRALKAAERAMQSGEGR